MRIGYSEDEDRPGQFALWHANCDRQIASKKGQAAMRELEAALIAMPNKRLIKEGVACEGELCTVGVLVVAIKVRKGADQDVLISELEDVDEDTDDWAEREGVPRLVAWKLVELNDILGNASETPEHRYERVLDYVRSEIIRTGCEGT